MFDDAGRAANVSVGCMLAFLIFLMLMLLTFALLFLMFASKTSLVSIHLYLSMPTMQVLHNSFHNGGAPYAAAVTNTTQAGFACLCFSQCGHHTYVPIPAVLVARPKCCKIYVVTWTIN